MKNKKFNPNRKLSRTQQVYLEIIYKLVRTHGHAHVGEISQRMNVSMASVTDAMRILEQKKLINYERRKYITLSPEAKSIALDLEKRRIGLNHFLEGILSYSKDESGTIAEQVIYHVDNNFCLRLDRYTQGILKNNN
jgi:DtxR family transcriptional regulator, Mn-dependent transcriptional regulator